jgi:nucleoside-diphosphate-sugar epimerase
MNILVTGGSGLVGRYVVDHLALKHTVSVLDKKPLHRTDLEFLEVDILDLEHLQKRIKGFDAVVHLAAIPNPLNDPPETVFRVNTLGTFNVLNTCERNGIGKLVFMSSESTLGFAFSTTRMWPEYVPVDEAHPARPQDPYGMSKLAGELLCQGFSRKVGLQTTCLRAPWIWVPEEREISMYRGLVDRYEEWPKNLWSYIHVNDVANAIGCALQRERKGESRTFFICAEDNWTGRESRALLSRFYPETKSIAEDFNGTASLVSNRKAKQELGFNPTLTSHDILG